MTDEWSEDLDAVVDDLTEDAEDAEDADEWGSELHDPEALQDAHMAETVARSALRDFCWAGRGLGWMRYRKGRWVEATEAAVAEQVRLEVIDRHAVEAVRGADVERLRKVSGLLSKHRIMGIAKLCEGITERDPADFDRHPNLLNVGNGVVDLTTGELQPHDPRLLLTKITPVNYLPDATSADWATALEALPAEVADWLQVRAGQAATGHPAPDDLLPILQGGGANGKTTITGSIARALGDHAVNVPERALMANKSDHPTELMTLRGARLALIEETPEARHLNVKRLKDTVGTPTMTARQISRNNVTWQASHSLFITTNYVPRVDETDHGTWRRLALVRFPYRYVNSQPTGPSDRTAVAGLRERLRDGRHGEHEAILAWVVEGARRWYEADRIMPPMPSVVADDTYAWRVEADLILGYINDRVTFDPSRHVPSRDLHEDFNHWLRSRGNREVSEVVFASRFGEHTTVTQHGVAKRRLRRSEGLDRPAWALGDLGQQYTAWEGVRMRRATDEAPDDRDDDTAADLREQANVQPVQGQLVGSHETRDVENRQITLHSVHTPTHHCSNCSQKLLHPESMERGLCARCIRSVAS